jgi:hypothetical protein
MNFNTIGTVFKKSTVTRVRFFKIIVALIISNLFFFLLFSPGSSSPQEPVKELSGWVEVQLEGHLFTPFGTGKKVILVNRKRGQQVEGLLQGEKDLGGLYNILIKEKDALMVLHQESWEILPYLQNFKLATRAKGDDREIHY